MQQQSQQQQGSFPNTPNTATHHAKKLSYANHGYKPSIGNKTIVSVSLQQVGSRSTSRRSSTSSSIFENTGLGGKQQGSVSRQQSLKSIGEEKRPRRGTLGRRRRDTENEGGIVVETTYQVQTAREDV